MAKKEFNKDMNDSADIMNTIATGESQNAEKETPKYYRINIAMPYYFKGYLAKASYDASRPGHIVSITEYINNLIRADMEKNHYNE